MADALQCDYLTGQALYALIRDTAGRVWNGAAFVAYATADVGDYDIPLAEQGTASGYYAAAVPAVPAGAYGLTVKLRAGGSPAESDVTVAEGSLEWSGTAILPLSTIAQRLAQAGNPAATAARAQPQRQYVGDDVDFDLALESSIFQDGETAADVSLEFVLAKRDGTVMIRKTSGAGITATGNTTVRVGLRDGSSRGLPVGRYWFWVRRTDPGREGLAAQGPWLVNPVSNR